MGRQSTVFRFADQLLDGTLRERLLRWRNEDELTLDQIARELANLEVEVSRETIRRWLQELGEAA